MTSTEALDKIERSTDATKETRWETTVSNPYFGEIQTIRKDLLESQGKSEGIRE